MKKNNIKTVWIFTLSILMITLLSSCNQEEEYTKKITETKSDVSSTHDSWKEMIDKEEWTEEEMKAMEWEHMDEKMMDKEEWTEEEIKSMGLEHMDEEMIEWKYLDYTAELVSNSTGNIVLSFHADWCPTCNALEKEILASTIPSDLTILKIDYDNSTDLKKKYWVITQTTLVQVDNDWNMITKWVWARDMEDIQSRLK